MRSEASGGHMNQNITPSEPEIIIQTKHFGDGCCVARVLSLGKELGEVSSVRNMADGLKISESGLLYPKCRW